MFVEPKVNCIASDEGFSVEVLSRTALIYTEGERSARIELEMLVGIPPMVVYVSRLKAWRAPHHVDVIDDVARARIADNIHRAFEFKGHNVDIA